MPLDSHRRPTESRDPAARLGTPAFASGYQRNDINIAVTDLTVLQGADASPAHEPGEFAEARAAEKAENARQSAIAARTVASHAQNAADCMSLLAMLGLDAMAGKRAKGDHF
ncbi:hypothetical protein [Nocardia sp. NPDC052566]|uniref:hypothetical protein n=1 Tax=Nocardia sp. NPDC052566 TaxID=3364330 RepID=UPI0037CBF839